VSSTAVEAGGSGSSTTRVMRWMLSFYRSTIGKKAVMALTGLIFVGYVVLHMLANLLIFQGPNAIDEYAALLRKSPAILWSARALLLGALLLHGHAAYALTRLARAARPRGYDRHVREASVWSSRSLRVGGVVLLIFVVYHILHFTLGAVHPDFHHLEVRRNVITGFQAPGVVAFYLVALVALGLHLAHGGWSMLQTLGLSHPQINPLRRAAAVVLALIIAGGFATVPLAVLFGWLR